MENLITIINYGMGNLNSISNMLSRLDIASIITEDPALIQSATKLILPGIGAFDTAVQHLKTRHLWDSIHHAVIEKKIPILGICLGMQLMTKKSEEGQAFGFGWIEAETKKFPQHKQYKVPHIGWNQIKPLKNEKFFKYYYDELKFYFVHSYYVDCDQPEDIMATTEYGKPFVSAFQKNNMIGVQFHPEKSHHYGMAFLQYFSKYFSNG